MDVWQAFFILSDSRNTGMGLGAIPLSEIESYMRLYGISGTDVIDGWLYLLREMDREFLAVMHEQQEKQ